MVATGRRNITNSIDGSSSEYSWPQAKKSKPNFKNEKPPAAPEFSDSCAPVQLGHEFRLIDVVLSDEPDKTVWENYRLDILINFCGAETLQRFLSHKLNGTPVLILPSQDCEPDGLHAILTWMIWAQQEQSPRIVPDDFFLEEESIYALCSVYRALDVLGFYQECETVHRLIAEKLSMVEYSVAQLQQALEILPARSYWVNQVLRHIRGRLRYMRRNGRQDGQCACGCKDEHGETSQKDCIVAWIGSNADLYEAVRLDVDSSDDSSDAGYCDARTQARVEKWILEVEDVQPLPPHVVPADLSLVGDVNHWVKIHKKVGSFGENYSLRWLDDDGGCYVETIPDEMSASLINPKAEISILNREWLVSRGYGANGSDIPGG